MALLLAVVVYYRAVYSPRAERLRDAKGRYAALKGEEERLKSSMPDVSVEQENYQALKVKYDKLLAEIQETEKTLPKNVHIPDILEFLVNDKDKYNLKIMNISSDKSQIQEVPLFKPAPGSKQKAISYYSILPVKLEVFGSFDSIIAYINNLEKKLPYQRIGNLHINMQKTAGGQPQCFMTMFSVLGRGEEEDESLEDIQTALAGTEESEDPFRKKGRPRIKERLTGAELNGIIHKKGVPHAIINGSTYKVGDLLQGKKIIEIDKDAVTLEEENKLFKLNLK